MKPILLMTILLSTLFIAGCTQKQNIPDGAVFQFETYGGHTSAETAKQVIIVSSKQITYAVYSQDNMVTETFQKNITKEEYASLLKLFNDKDFLSMKDKYSPPEITIMDAGSAKITANFGNTTKSVLLEPYFLEYYSDNVKIITEKMQSYINTIYDVPEEDLKMIAQDWITRAPTYSYDGDELQFKDIGQLDTKPKTYVLKYSFKSGGYGARNNSAGIELISAHEIVLAINNRKVVAAVIDGKWDELNQKPYETTLKFQPVICIKTPWRKWYEAGNIQFVKEPREEELVIAYYGQVYGITVQNFKLVSGDPRVILCGDPESYYYTADVSVSDREQMLKLGWKDS